MTEELCVMLIYVYRVGTNDLFHSIYIACRPT